jgi:hypothetical protein
LWQYIYIRIPHGFVLFVMLLMPFYSHFFILVFDSHNYGLLNSICIFDLEDKRSYKSFVEGIHPTTSKQCIVLVKLLTYTSLALANMSATAKSNPRMAVVG